MKHAQITICRELTGVPAEIQVIPFGRHETDKGAFVLDEEGAELVMAAFGSRRNDLAIDYEHQTLTGAEAPASGWIKRLINKGADGIWAEVEWTPRAVEYLNNREYRYLSPVFLKTLEDGRVVELLGAGLTNAPAIDGMVPLVNRRGDMVPPAYPPKDGNKRFLDSPPPGGGRERVGVIGMVHPPLSPLPSREGRKNEESETDGESVITASFSKTPKGKDKEQDMGDGPPAYPPKDGNKRFLDSPPPGGNSGCRERSLSCSPLWKRGAGGDLMSALKHGNPPHSPFSKGGEKNREGRNIQGQGKLQTNTMTSPSPLSLRGERGGLQTNTKEEADMTFLEQLAGLVGLPAEATEEEIMQAVGGIASRLADVLSALELDDTASASEATGTIAAMKQGAGQATAMATELASLKSRQDASDAEALVAQAMKDGKVTPAQKEWAMGYATRDPEGFRVFATKAPQVVPGGEVVTGGSPGARPDVDDVQLSVNRALGVSDESFRKYGKREG